MENRHERRLNASFDEVAALVAALAGPDDRIWPTDRWPALRMDQGQEPGSAGGHGFVRYRVIDAGPGFVTMRFDPQMRLDGTHAFDVEARDGHVVIRHIIDAEPRSWMRLAWPLLVEPLHDALIEDALDGVEAAVDGRPLVRRPLSRRVRARRRLLTALRPAAVPEGAAGRTARDAALGTAGALFGLAAIHLVWGSGSPWPFRDSSTLVRHVVGRTTTSSAPGPTACVAVAGLLVTAGVGIGARPLARRTPALIAADLVTTGAAVILAARGVGGFVGSSTGLIASTPEFRRNDVRYFAPLCVALAFGARAARGTPPIAASGRATRTATPDY